MIRLEEILDRVGKYHPGDNLDLIRRAYIFSAKEHKGQVRASGEPYLTHPLEVANLLAEMKMDAVTVSVGLLHDVVEDTLASLENIEELFGADVAHIVDGVTKISQIQFTSKEEKQAENFRKMLLAMTDDIRVIMVKFADRLHNMRTLAYLPANRREAIARETMDIYAPLANRLGMGKIRGELEDLAFSYIDPKAHQELKDIVERKRRAHEAFLAEITKIVQEKMKEAGIPCSTESRIKRLYSIYTKLRKQRITIDQVFDLLAVRIITDDVKNCYAALGVIHNTWRPVPGRIKDFIAMPRPNMYQSLHTSVIAGGQSFEVQIRTAEMHRIAEEGIAAHWKYKDGKLVADDREDQRVSWLRHLVEWQQEMKDPADFLSTLKIDLYPEEVYTFTPKGKVVTLPREATPVDFAYAIHTEVGHSCAGAKINARMTPLKTKLRNGDIVEILTQPGHKPSRDWLSFVKTSRARNKIRHWLTEQESEKAIELGRRLLEKEARKYKQSAKDLIESEKLRGILPDYGSSKVEDLLSAIGYGKVSAKQLISRLSPDSVKEAPAEEESRIASVVKRVLGLGADAKLQVKGFDELLVYRAKCCSPIRGEEVIGYITRGKGVAVHSKNCPNVQNLLYDADRKIEVEWVGAAPSAEAYAVPLTILTEDREDRPGMLAEIAAAISEVHSNILNVEARTGDEGGTIDITVEIPDMKHLERVIASIKKIDGVYDVSRSTRTVPTR
ncbi:MAG: bifunctional (p)ppGpp synthetase/guanosine-3',5'-bis(diphosphate) 3'-pyrophosphohydrolase [Acidobacteria bacterium]|nr:bifunctional (p)ppGpp synthetase/guanosine-3',5'-bis(diphosphate) 3'-pyrophosphohydrolase [Acidobacteriota bacterium]